MFTKVLVANRGEIACRVIRTLDRLGIQSVAIHSEAERLAPHVAMATEAHCVGPASVAESYLRQDRIIELARSTGAQAIHPGYGLLSENAGFAEACEQAGIVFIGPTSANIRDFGLKHEARRLAVQAGVPLLPGTGLLADVNDAVIAGDTLGYPVMLKSTAGGGGIGMRVCNNADELRAAWDSIERLARSHFGQGGLFLEKLVTRARHLEVQLFGDGRGTVRTLGVRDCSAQRRNQKVIEETPPAGIPAAQLEALQTAARRLGETAHYKSAGTAEFLWDLDAQAFYFLEVNTRLQVEHCVTEAVTGLDLVEWMLRVAAGEPLPDAPAPVGHAIQARIYAEDPARNFQPSSGTITHFALPAGVRWDSWIDAGTEVTPYYDPLLGKLIVHGSDRADAVARLQAALAAMEIHGIETNLRYLRAVAASGEFHAGGLTTRTLAGFAHAPRRFDVQRPGTMTTVQDHPGRLGLWEVGVPPSGPMDGLSFRLANRIAGNEPGAAGLEITADGPTLRFHAAATIALAGAEVPLVVDGSPHPMWTKVDVPAGATVAIGRIAGFGARAYLAVRGGIDVPEYLGSRSTFTLGQFGGHAGRALRAGDAIYFGEPGERRPNADPVVPLNHRPAFGPHYTIGVLYGPHGAPDFFTPDYIERFFATDWTVHYNSARTGVRLTGPKPGWARTDGGEAGLHPSNIHDNAYAVGAIDFTGDMPIILGPDGPSLGGFVCPAVVVSAELWKLGQLRPGDTVRFEQWTPAQADAARAAQEALFAPAPPARRSVSTANAAPADCVIHTQGTGDDALVIRRAGDAYLLAEFGTPRLSLDLRFKVQLAYEALGALRLPGIIDLTPGIRSLQVHFDPGLLPGADAVDALRDACASLPPLDAMEVPSRIVHLPLSWDDPATQLATRKYMQVVRPDAPWCPDNIEFIRRINGLSSRQDVHDIVFGASYLVLGLGDVYLGAPVATPLDPRHRLVTTKYNPARTWTPENAVGIGGAYLCVYGMEGPGGYQFVGRTIQMWSRHHTRPPFEPGKPWLLRLFDQVRFHPVGADELLRLREDFPRGRYQPRIEETTLRLRDHRAFVNAHAAGIAEFKQRQQEAFEAERARWSAAEATAAPAEPEPPQAATGALPPGTVPVESLVAGSVWKVLVNAGDRVTQGQPLAVLESMKMEIPVESPAAGTVAQVLCREGQAVAPGQALVALVED